MNKNEKTYWLDDARNVRKVIVAIYATCLLLALADLLYHKHVHFNYENWFGFYALYGFVSCVLLVLLAKLMRIVLGRKEDYYDR